MKKSVLSITIIALLVNLLAGCATPAPAPSAAPSSTKEVVKIGILQPVEHPSLNTIRESIIAELESLGLGDKIEVEYKNAQGDASTLNTIATQFVTDGKDLLVPIATPSAQAVAAATKSIPIVFAAVSDPVSAGLVKDLATTDGNITGVSDVIPVDQIFELAAEMTPQAKTFGVLYCSGESNSYALVEKAREYAKTKGIELVEVTIADSSELQQAAQSLVGRVDAIFTPNDNVVATAMTALADVGIQAKLPVYVGADSMVADGGLATVGIDYTVLGKQVAAMIKEIIDGKTIAQNPVQSMTDFAKIINSDTAEKIGLTLSPELLKGAQLIGQ